jgi:Na+/H+-dicarboxylate symporter
MSLGAKAFFGLVAGLLLGGILAALARPAAGGVAIVADLLGGLWINAILMTIVPMIVAKVIVTFAQNEATVILRNAGWTAIVLIAALLVIPPVLTALVMPELFAWFSIDPATASSLRENAIQAGQGIAPSPTTFSQWLLSLVPRNPIRAAADSAILPLIVFSLALGLALSRVREASREVISAFFRAVDEAIMVILNVVVRLAPVGIFSLALAMSVRVGPAVFGALGYYMLVSSLTLAVFIIIPYVTIALATPISFLRFAKGCAPAQMVAFATHSSLASLPAMLEGAEIRLGLPRALSGVVLPLAASTYRYSAPIWFVTVVYFVGQLYGIPMDPARLATIFPVAILASITVGGVPSGAVYAVLPVLMAAGLPADAVGILLAVDPIPNAFRTTLNVTGEMAVVTLLGGKKKEASGE